MSYAIVRNEKLTRAEINGKGTHNDRKAKNHTNKDIDPTKTHLNYYIKKNKLTYTKEFDKYLKENNLQCHLRSNSIIMCQMVFTSDQAFFDKIGEKETKRYFDDRKEEASGIGEQDKWTDELDAYGRKRARK